MDAENSTQSQEEQPQELSSSAPAERETEVEVTYKDFTLKFGEFVTSEGLKEVGETHVYKVEIDLPAGTEYRTFFKPPSMIPGDAVKDILPKTLILIDLRQDPKDLQANVSSDDDSLGSSVAHGENGASIEPFKATSSKTTHYFWVIEESGYLLEGPYEFGVGKSDDVMKKAAGTA